MTCYRSKTRVLLAGILLLGSFSGSGERTPLLAEPSAASTANLDAVLWMQKSPEYALAAAGQWRALAAQLPRLKRGGEALAESELPAARNRRLPPAIIVDLDETVIDNSPANAQGPTGLAFDEDRWQAWLLRVDEQFAVPGAVEALTNTNGRCG
jgi:predicted secreted acid phosphatase